MQKHDYQIDIVRIVAMLMIIGLHICGHGGVLQNVKVFSVNYFFFWTYECLCIAGVNLFAIISGYILYDKKAKFTNIIRLWIKVLFFSVITASILNLLFDYSFTLEELLSVFFPIFRKHYWYPTVYFGLYLISPFLNYLVSTLRREFMERLLFILFLIMSVFPTLAAKDLLDVPTGSFSWLAFCFLIGSYTKKYNFLPLFGKLGKVRYYFIITCVLVIMRYLIDFLALRINNIDFIGNYYICNTSFLVLLQAMSLFHGIMTKNTIRSFMKIIVEICGKASFTVYLIHENFMFRQLVIKNRFMFLTECGIVKCIFIVTCVSLAIYLMGVIGDYIFDLLIGKRVSRLNKYLEKYNKLLDIE